MVKTLRITSVAAVLLAGLVLASVLGYLRPTMLVQLGWGAGGGDKQVEKILAGPTACERFQQQNGNKGPNSEDTTPPLVKQAEILAGIINPPAPPDAPNPPEPKVGLKPPTLAVKPAAAVSSKFELLGTSYCSNPQSSFAYIRLPDNTVQWVGVGSQIGHITIKEIRNGAIVCWDGTIESEMTTVPTPETSSLLETSSASAAPVPSTVPVTPAATRPLPGVKTGAGPVKGTSSATVQGWGHPAASASSLPAVPVPPAPAAQISQEEQEDLSRLGDRLKNSGKTGPAEREEINKMIAEFRANRSNVPETGALANSGGPADSNRDSSTEALRLQWKQKLLNSRARNR